MRYVAANPHYSIEKSGLVKIYRALVFADKGSTL